MAQNNQKKYAQIKSPFYGYDEFAEFTPFAIFQFLRNLFIWGYNHLNYESISGNYITNERVEFDKQPIFSNTTTHFLHFRSNQYQNASFFQLVI